MTFTSPHPRTPIARPYPTIRGATCQRCFLRMQDHPDHVCCFNRGYTSCRYCIDVRHRCIPIPDEIQPVADAAMQLEDVEKQAQIREIRQTIRIRTRKLNEEANMQAAADTQLYQNLQDQLAFEQNSARGESATLEETISKSIDAEWMRTSLCNVQ